MSKTAKILWLDLEMTGLEPGKDVILEAAAIATDWEFNEIATFEAAAHYDEAFILERFATQQLFWDENPEARDGLLEQNKSAIQPSEVEVKFLAFINEHFDSDEKVLLGGNSIHNDRNFIKAEWSDIEARLHYRMLDVSAWKVVFGGKYKKMFAKDKSHRALDDIRGSIMELKYYLDKVNL
jgi:oligoribonuclease